MNEPKSIGNIINFQSNRVVSHAINGTKINWPAANAEVSNPVINPLLLLNHLVATAADKPKPKIPEAIPKQTPILKN